MSQARASAGPPALKTWFGIIRKRRSGAIGMLDGTDGAAQFGEAAQPADRGIAGIGSLGFCEIVEHAMAVIGPKHDLVFGRTPAVFPKQRLQNCDHVDVAVEMICLEER